MSKAKVVMYDNQTKVVRTFVDKHGLHARLFWNKSKCPILKPDGSSDSEYIKKWVTISDIKVTEADDL